MSHLSFTERVGVVAWRALMNTGAVAGVWKGPGAQNQVTVRHYGSRPAERLDIIERRDGLMPHPPVVFMHCGGWISGRKEIYRPALGELASVGHPVFNVDYPLAPEAQHPTHLRSVLTALAWIRQQYPQYASVHIAGDSAGGNLAMMAAILCANTELLGNIWPDTSTPFPSILSVTSLYAVLDRLSWLESDFPSARLFLRAYAGDDAFARDVPPELAITPADLDFEHIPPCFIGVGELDPLIRSSEMCAQRLQKLGHDVTLRIYPGAWHGLYVSGEGTETLRADVRDFLATHGPKHPEASTARDRLPTTRGGRD